MDSKEKQYTLTRGLTSILCVIVFAILVATPDRANADVNANFRRARSAYERGEYKNVILMLKSLIYPQNKLSTRNQLIEGHKMLGISYFFEKQQQLAEQSFLALLTEDPKATMDPVVDPPSAISFFNRVKRRNTELLRKIEAKLVEERRRKADLAKRKKQQRRQKMLDELFRSRKIIKNRYWVNFLPFRRRAIPKWRPSTRLHSPYSATCKRWPFSSDGTHVATRVSTPRLRSRPSLNRGSAKRYSSRQWRRFFGASRLGHYRCARELQSRTDHPAKKPSPQVVHSANS